MNFSSKKYARIFWNCKNSIFQSIYISLESIIFGKVLITVLTSFFTKKTQMEAPSRMLP